MKSVTFTIAAIALAAFSAPTWAWTACAAFAVAMTIVELNSR